MKLIEPWHEFLLGTTAPQNCKGRRLSEHRVHLAIRKMFQSSLWNLLASPKLGQVRYKWGQNPQLSEYPNVHLPHGEGNGTPLQYSCLENPRDRGVHEVAKSRTRLKWLSSSSSSVCPECTLANLPSVMRQKKLPWWLHRGRYLLLQKLHVKT